MTTLTVDARGLPCPQPVIRARNAMREANEVLVLVTGEDQVGNVRRLAEKAGWQVSVERQPDHLRLRLVQGQQTGEPELTPDLLVCDVTPTKRTVLVLSGEQMGRGEDKELGAILVRSFFHTLTEISPAPQTIILYNTGVKLAVEGSPVLDDLKMLAAQGAEILVCGTCLGYFQLKDRLAVGTISNMYTIAEAMLTADHIVQP